MFKIDSDYKCEYNAQLVDGKMIGGYLNTAYSGSDTFSRTNHVIGVGIDYKFWLQGKGDDEAGTWTGIGSVKIDIASHTASNHPTQG